MTRFTFHTTMGDLRAEEPGSSFGPIDGERWRTTSTLISVGVTKPAVAVADGEAFLQPSDTSGRVNLFLRNPPAPAFLDGGISYLVYRGILRSSLVGADGTTLRNEPGLTARAWAGRAPADPPTIDDLVTDVQGRPPADAAAELAASDRFVPVRRGDPLGRFATDSVSLDVVLADPAPRLTDGFLRATANVLEVDTDGLSGDARWLVESIQRARLTGYLDPCHLFTPLWHEGLLDFSGQPPPQWAEWMATWENSLLSTFDLRNEHDLPLNFYRDLGPDPAIEPQLRVRRSNEPHHVVEATTQGWPLLRGEWLAADETGPARIQFPRAGDPGPALVHVRGPDTDRLVAAPPDTEPAFTRAVDIDVPRHEPVWLPTAFTIRYRRADPSAGGAGAAYRPPVAHRFDAVLDRSWLAGADRRPPAPWRGELRPLVRRALLDRAGGGTRPDPVWLGHAVDDHGVYLIARPDRPRLDPVAPVMRTEAPLITDDDRMARLLPSLAGHEIRTAGGIFRIPAVADPGPGWMVVAMTHAEFAVLAAGGASDPDRSIARLHLLPLPDPAPGLHRLTLARSSAAVSPTGSLQVTAPTALADGPRFDVDDPDPAVLLSADYLASLATPATNRDTDQSFILPGVRLTLRRSPTLGLIGQAAWEAAGRDRSGVADDAHNAIGQTVGDRPIRVAVLGHKATPGGPADRAMLVEILEAVRLLHPADVLSNYAPAIFSAAQPPQAPSSPRLVDVQPGQRAWLIMTPIAEQGLSRVVSLAKFERDVGRLLEKMEEARPERSLADHLTHLRMLTQIRDADVSDNELRLSRLFDVVIGSVVDPPLADLTPTVDSLGRTDPILAAAADPPQLETIDGVAGVDTTLSLLTDYGAVHLAGDLIIDLFHVFVGLEVMRDRAEPVTLIPEHLEYAAEEGLGDSALSFMADVGDFRHELPDRVAASLWSGDVAAAFAKENHHSHRDWEDDWNREAGSDLVRRAEVFRRHYFASAAGDVDLVADVLAYRLAPDVRARHARHRSLRRAVVDGFHDLAARLAVEGLRPTAEAFVDRIADDASRGGAADLVAWIDLNLERFAAVFEMNDRFAEIIASGSSIAEAILSGTNPFRLPEATLEQIAVAVRARPDLGQGEPPPLANLLIDWIESVSGRTILDREDP